MFVPPLSIRKLRAAMEMKWVGLGEVARAAGVNYAVASAVLSGRRIDEAALAKLTRVIEKAPMPKGEEASV